MCRGTGDWSSGHCMFAWSNQGGKSGPIAEGYRGVLAFHKGDEKYMQKAELVEHSTILHGMCLLSFLLGLPDGELMDEKQYLLHMPGHHACTYTCMNLTWFHAAALCEYRPPRMPHRPIFTRTLGLMLHTGQRTPDASRPWII